MTEAYQPTSLPESPRQKHQETKGEDRVVCSWIAPEYIQHQRSARWYLVAGTIVAICALLALISGNWSMALAIAVFAGVYQYLHQYHPPKDIKITISDLGIRVGNVFFPYSHIQAFWIIYSHGNKTLNLRVANNFFYDITIQLNEQDPVFLRTYLVGQIPEWEGKEERLGDIMLRLLKL